MKSRRRIAGEESSYGRRTSNARRVVQSADDALPEFALARLGPAQALKHFVELRQSVRSHAERVARAADDADELVVVDLSYVVYAGVSALYEPTITNQSLKIIIINPFLFIHLQFT